MVHLGTNMTKNFNRRRDSFDAQWSGLSGEDKAALRKLIQKDTSDLLKVYFGIESKK
jgi:hypothetical protein